MKNTKTLKKIIIPFSILTAIFLTIILLFYNGVLWFNMPSEKNYPVRGVDVSHYQDEINWDILASQNLDFAFIKATEGSSHQDRKFTDNLENSLKTSLYVGAYHFFSFDSSGITQAQNFINTVPIFENSLPPVIDLEFYGDKYKNPPSREHTQSILNDMIALLKENYNQTPIIYTTSECYDLYLKDNYEDIYIWIRDITSKPSLSDNKNWTFWQYSNRTRLKGYDGKEPCIDMNVFNGSLVDFKNTFNLP